MASITIKDFKENIKGIVRPNRFMVDFEMSSELSSYIGSEGEDMDLLRYSCKSAALPGRTIGEFEMKYYGQTLKLHGDTSYGDLNMNFLCDPDWKVRGFFEKWQEFTQQLWNGSGNNNRRDDINVNDSSVIVVSQLGNTDQVVATYEYHYCFPKEVQEIELNMESNDTAMEFQVTFNFDYWKRR